MGAGLEERRDDPGDGFANARYFAKPVLRYQVFDWLGQQRHTVGCPQIGFCAVRIATIKHGPAAKLLEQAGDVGSVGRRHGCE